MYSKPIERLIMAVVLASAALGAAVPSAAAEKPVAPERNPPGDIPDTQVFVTYQSPLGFTIKVPEGWSRTTDAQSVHFSDKYNTIVVIVSTLAAAPTIAAVKAEEVPQLQKASRAVKVDKIREVKLKSGAAILVSYTSNSDPNPVTNKQIRLEHDRYLFFKDGEQAALDMAAPQGADNVDDWALMANSFRWK